MAFRAQQQKGHLKKTASGFAKFPRGPPESFDVEIFLFWSAHPVALLYDIFLQPLTDLEVIIKILNSYYTALINQSKQLPWQWYIHQLRQMLPDSQTEALWTSVEGWTPDSSYGSHVGFF